MKRYYLSKIKKVFEPNMGVEVYRHRFQELADGRNLTYVGGEIAVDPQTGIPTQKALLILVDAVDHRQFANDQEMVEVPEVSLDVKTAAIANATMATFRAKAQQIGFEKAEVDAIVNGADALRNVVDGFGKLNNPAFDTRNFDVA